MFRIQLNFEFSDCYLLAKSLIIKCSKTLSDLGYREITYNHYIQVQVQQL